MGTWHDPGLGRPIAAPLDRCAELLGVDLASLREVAAKIEPYLRADGASIWSLDDRISRAERIAKDLLRDFGRPGEVRAG